MFSAIISFRENNNPDIFWGKLMALDDYFEDKMCRRSFARRVHSEETKREAFVGEEQEVLIRKTQTEIIDPLVPKDMFRLVFLLSLCFLHARGWRFSRRTV